MSGGCDQQWVCPWVGVAVVSTEASKLLASHRFSVVALQRRSHQQCLVTLCRSHHVLHVINMSCCGISIAMTMAAMAMLMVGRGA